MALQTQQQKSSPSGHTSNLAIVLQRKCACGGTPGPTGECIGCRHKRIDRQAKLPLQTKLAINQPGDVYEVEADRVADQILYIPVALAPCQGEFERHPDKQVQRPAKVQAQRQTSMAGGNHTVAPTIVHDVLHTAGQPLDSATRSFMEARFGHRFDQVRVHTTIKAAESANAINARAYTLGPNIVFGTGQYSPGSHEGRRLLAHELTHVVQQNAFLAKGAVPQIQRQLTSPGNVRFRQCTQHGNALEDFAVFPEEGETLFTPGDGTLHQTDGFWWRYHDPSNEWFKISNTCDVDVDCTETGIQWDDDCSFFIDAEWTSEQPPAAGGGRNPFV